MEGGTLGEVTWRSRVAVGERAMLPSPKAWDRTEQELRTRHWGRGTSEGLHPCLPGRVPLAAELLGLPSHSPHSSRASHTLL